MSHTATPTNTRMMSPAFGGAIKLTPSSSPFPKNTPTRSPMKRAEVSLALRQVIGTTTNSPNAFDSLSSGRCFSYTAGAAAVVATINEEHHVSQRFFRARPTTNPVNPSASIYGGPSTPNQIETRSRTAASLRDAGSGISPHTSPAPSEWADSPNNRAWSNKDKVKAATCVSLSPDGRYLAVGETGYKPRVLIFSNLPDAPSDTPLTSISDHSFGVNCVAFSPDSRYLASLGFSNDGFLYIWSINPRTGAAALFASNKCVSNINRMAWMGNKLITVGTRHVKVWKIDEANATIRASKARQSDTSALSSSVHKTLPGRNCLLGNLHDAIFTSVVPIAANKAIVASDKGDMCLIDDTNGDQTFTRLGHAGFAVSAMAVDVKERLHLASGQGGFKTLQVRDMTERLTPPPSPTPRVESPTVSVADSEQIGAIACLADYVITVDSERAIHLSQLCGADETTVGELIHTMPAHGDSVLGVSVLSPNFMEASYYTWSAGGMVIFWNPDGNSKGTMRIPLEQVEGVDVMPNELKTVRASNDASFLVAGDKYGVLRIMDCKTKSSVFDFKAHASEITSIAIHQDGQHNIVACASRDRMVQTFALNDNTWELLQTMDEHAGAVNRIVFSRNGTRLVSSSSDRTLVVRDLVSREESGQTMHAFMILRTIDLKATPVSLAWDVEQDDVLLVSTIDRQVHKYDTRNGQCLSSFRTTDTDGGDAVVLSSIAHVPRGWSSPLIAGVSSTDKSIRIYDENGALIARDWGHTEGVSDIALVQSSGGVDNSNEKSLVTVAVDGTIFIWDLAIQAPSRHDVSRSMDLLGPNTPSNQDLLATKPPLRRVLSNSEMARFQRSPEDDNVTPTGNRSPKLRTKLSKFSIPKLEASPISTRESRTGSSQGYGTTRRNRNRSPSPPSPRNPQHAKRRASMDVKTRSKAPVNEFGSLGASTESLCRSLRAYRKRLANSTDTLSSELVKEVERELAATSRAVGERVKSKEFDETIMAKMLDQYSERLVSLMDERIAERVALEVRQRSEGLSGAPSPVRDTAPELVRQHSRDAQDPCSNETASTSTFESATTDDIPSAEVAPTDIGLLRHKTG
ncbi:WD repeat protein-like protein [Dothidotthia symphoricarpi CBS 119687]|uniref:WD repeat protein-like protein n=1 Tax=Dothidotthia symphoricarpi CBS 119687 TaxID=1392245 RepID=A0A6A6AKC4_9PLEO|nr:WD repeat protein-like protein [Dothidotthia symphoricarpi CBS 119687]KAF2130891.1 WD repeat protein-like protein [Dothidotthia symphoricarpi CBS 119687]